MPFLTAQPASTGSREAAQEEAGLGQGARGHWEALARLSEGTAVD